MAALPAIATIATVVGTGVSAYGTIAGGKAQSQQLAQQGLAERESSELQARQLIAKGKEEMAASQQEAAQYRRNKDLALSTLQNRAAAGGFSATDPTAMALSDEIDKYGTLQEKLALWGGSSRRAGLESQAAGARFSGDSAYSAALQSGANARKASWYDAAGTILGGVSTLAAKYDPQASSTTAPSYRYGGATENPMNWQTTVRYG
jgi:hypothetical protein